MSESEVDRITDELERATGDLMAAPAPDVASLATKIEIAIAESPLPEGGGIIEAAPAAAILRDARALG